MELVNQKDPIIEKSILRLCKALFYLIAVMTTSILGYLVMGPSTDPEVTSSSPLPKVDKSVLGNGALSIIPNGSSLNIQSILQDLILVGVNTRPDQDRQLTLALRSTGQQKTVLIGETVYLQSKDTQWNFSTDPTDTSLLPYSLENHHLICEIKKPSLQTQCILTPSPIFSKSLQNESYTHLLKKAGVWGPDVFLTEWGGEEYRDLTKKLKISIGPDVFFLKLGDCIWWNGTRWMQEGYTNEPGPVAQLVKTSSPLSQGGVDFQIWDETGFSSETIHLSPQASPQPHFKIAELMTAIRPRSSSEITCQLGKRRVIVKEGDWWIRADNRWKQVRTAADLDACLYHQIPGELFIFEKIETLRGKVVLKGRAFDRMRTSSEPISLIVQTEKRHPFTPSKPVTGNPSLMTKHRTSRPMILNSSKEQEGL